MPPSRLAAHTAALTRHGGPARVVEALAALKDRVMEYLNYREECADPERVKQFGAPEPVEMPGEYELLGEMDATGLPYRAGGLEDQPYLLTRSLLAVRAAVAERERFRQLAERGRRQVPA